METIIKKLNLFILKAFSSFNNFLKISRIQEGSLKKHMKDLINQGYSQNNIMERLINAGFKKENIENVLMELEGNIKKEQTKNEEARLSEDETPIRVIIEPTDKKEKGEMDWLDLFYLASRSFRNRASRTLLTSLGVSVGFGTILVLVSLGYGLENVLIKQLASSDALLSISVFPPESIKFTPEKLSDISNFDGVVEISPLALFSSELTLGDVTSNTFVYATSPSYFKLSAIKPKAGEALKEDSPYSAVVSSALMESLVIKNYEDILNKEIKLTLFIPVEEGEQAGTIELKPIERPLKIVGVIEDPTTSYLYLNINFVKDLKNLSYREAKVKVAKTEYITPVQEKIINIGFLASALSDTVKQANKVFKAIQIILAVFGTVALIVSSIGMVNTMTITLLERINEIGIMKAIGATNRDIKKLFLAESLLIAAVGGVGGIIIGMLAETLLNLGFNILAKNMGGKAVNLFYQPLWFILALIIFPIAIGFLTGFLPAKKASKINPLKALRYK